MRSMRGCARAVHRPPRRAGRGAQGAETRVFGEARHRIGSAAAAQADEVVCGARRCRSGRAPQAVVRVARTVRGSANVWVTVPARAGGHRGPTRRRCALARGDARKLSVVRNDMRRAAPRSAPSPKSGRTEGATVSAATNRSPVTAVRAVTLPPEQVPPTWVGRPRRSSAASTACGRSASGT